MYVLLVFFDFCFYNSFSCTNVTVQTATVSGQEIAEWVVKNREELNLKYVIWGQRIWNPSRDDVTGWENWRPMDDRGSVTANHWYVFSCEGV